MLATRANCSRTVPRRRCGARTKSSVLDDCCSLPSTPQPLLNKPISEEEVGRLTKSVSPPDLTEPAPPLVSESAGDEQVKLPETDDTELDACTSGTGLNTHCTFSMTAAYPLYDGKRKITTSSGQHQDSLSLMSSMSKLDSSGRCTLAHVCLNAVHSVNHAAALTCVQTVRVDGLQTPAEDRSSPRSMQSDLAEI